MTRKDYKFRKDNYPTLSEFDEWTHKFVKDILNGRIKGGRFVGTPEGVEWRQRPLIDMLSKIVELVAEDIHILSLTLSARLRKKVTVALVCFKRMLCSESTLK